MAKIIERLAIVEVEVKNLKKLIYILIAAVTGQVGFTFLPL